MTLDGSDDFSRDDQVLLQVERVNQAVENVHNTIGNICAILDRIEARQKALAEKVEQIAEL
jgi:archaellum component FlaC